MSHVLFYKLIFLKNFSDRVKVISGEVKMERKKVGNVNKGTETIIPFLSTVRQLFSFSIICYIFIGY